MRKRLSSTPSGWLEDFLFNQVEQHHHHRVKTLFPIRYKKSIGGPKRSRFAKDKSGHEHKGKGPGGGQFATVPDGEGEGRTPEELGKKTPITVQSLVEDLDAGKISVPNAKKLARSQGMRRDTERGPLADAIRRAEQRKPKRELTPEEKQSLADDKVKADKSRAIEEMQGKQIEAAEKALAEAGAKRTHVSESGSSYWKLPNGETLRLSDHALPPNASRDSRSEDPWDNEIVFSGRGNEDTAVDRIRDLLGESSSPVQSWAAKKFKDQGHDSVSDYPIEDKGKWHADEDYKARGGTLEMISPQAFLANAKPLEMDDETEENIEILKQHILDGKKLDPLVIYGDASNVRNSDGRHRAMAAIALGIKSVPVLNFTGKKLSDTADKYSRIRYRADDPFAKSSTQPVTQHKPGDTKSENGQTYRLNQNSRWERIDEQGNVIDDAQEQPPEQANEPHPVIGELLGAMKQHPDYQGRDVLTQEVHHESAAPAYEFLKANAGKQAAGGHVVDFGGGKIGYASTKGAMIFEPTQTGMKVHFSDKTEMAGHNKPVRDDKGNPQAPITATIPDHKPHREKADKARVALDEATKQWAEETGKGLDRHGHAAWRRHVSALRSQWRQHEAIASSLERQHKARAAEIQKAEKERQKASQPPRPAKEPKQPKESPKQPVAEKPEEASPLFDQAKPGGDVPDTSKPQAYWDLPTSGRRAFDGVSKHLRDHELDDTPENRSAIQKAILSGHVTDKSDLRQVLAAAKRKHDSGNLADSDSGVLNDAIKKKANRAPVESWKSIVKQKADEWDMTPDDFDEVANQVWGEKMKHHEATQQAGQAARLLTGLTAKDINSLENQGYDSGSNHPKTKGLDDIGRSMASQFPELGWGRGYTGEAGVDDTDYGEHVWNLLRAGEQKPPAKNSPEFMQEIEDYLQHNMDGGSSMTDAEREELAATPFHRIGLVDRYGRRLKSAPGQKNLFNEGASAKKQKRWTQEDEAKHKRDDKGEFSEKPGASALDEATGDSDIETVTQKAIAAIDGMDMGTRDGERDAMRAVSRVASDHDLSPNELWHDVMYEVSPRDIEGELAEPEIDAEDSLSNATKVKAERDRKDTESAMPDEQIQDSNRNTRKAREARNKAMLPSDEQTAKAMDSEKPAAHPAILRFESNVATLKYEKCHCVDEDGRFVLSKEGEKSQISFTEDERETIRNRKGVVFSHNHPSGTSFSREDIVFAAAHGLKQIRAVGDKYVYTMESAGEWMSPKEIAEVSGQEDENVRREFTDKILGGRMTVEDAESSHWHEVWTRIADRLGLVYKRAERPK